jgi:hypothetical protein
LSPNALAIDSTNIYWANEDEESGVPSNNGSIAMASLGGGMQVLAGQRLAPSGIAVDATTVYWVDAGTATASGSVNKVPIAGGPVTMLASAVNPSAIAVDATNVYFTTISVTAVDPGGHDTYASTIARVPKAGGAVTVLVKSGVYTPSNLLVDATSAYWVDGGDRSSDHTGIFKVAIGGGVPTALAIGDFYNRGLALDASSVYFATRDSIKKVPVAGGTATTLATAPDLAPSPGALAVDAHDVFFTTTGNQSTCMQYRTGTIAKIPISGGAITTLATQQAIPSAIAVDGAKVYWAEWLGNRVYSTSKY